MHGQAAQGRPSPFAKVEGVVARDGQRVTIDGAKLFRPGDTLVEARVVRPALIVERNGFPIPPDLGMELQKGDIIATGEGTVVVVTFDGARVVVQPNTKVTLGSIFDWFGEVFISGWLKTETEYVSAAVEGTEYAVRVDASGCTTAVTVVHGSVSVSSTQLGRRPLTCSAAAEEPGQPSPVLTSKTLDRRARVLPGERLTVAPDHFDTQRTRVDPNEFNRLVALANGVLGIDNAPRLPLLTGLDVETAKRTLAGLPIQVHWQNQPSKAAPVAGTIIRQDPAPGTRGTQLTLWLGAQPPTAKLDTDNDEKAPTVADDNRCPREPMTYNGFEDDAECPGLMMNGTVLIESNEIIILDKVQFETQSAKILPESNGIIEAVAATLKGHPEMELMELAGHADERANDDLNLRLTAARARAVLEALVSRGVERKRLRSVGYGELCPLDARSNPAAWDRNRRVELKVVRTSDGPTGVKLGCEAAAKKGLVRKYGP